MSGTASPSVAVGSGGGGGGELGYSGGYHVPFTAMQWQELANQAMIYKYLVAGLPVPPDLVVPIRRSFEALSARFFTHPSLGYCSYYGKKFDPEPGRCRRTDGKKWRCSKDAHPDSKYCERHMHRGRNRSRKPVESQSALQSLSTAMPHISHNVDNNSNNNAGNNAGNFQVTGSGSFQNVPLYSVQVSEGSSFGIDATKLQMEPISCEMGDNKEFRYVHDHGFSPEASGSLGGLGLSSCGTWHFMPSQVSSTTSFAKQRSDPQLLNLSSAQEDNIDAASHGFEPMMSEQRTQQQGQEHEQHLVHPFFTEWPIAKASWSSLDDDRVNDGSNKNFFSSTQLSISIPRTYDFSSRSGYSPND